MLAALAATILYVNVLGRKLPPATIRVLQRCLTAAAVLLLAGPLLGGAWLDNTLQGAGYNPAPHMRGSVSAEPDGPSARHPAAIECIS